MVKSFDIPEFDRFVIFVAVIILLYIVKPSKTRSIRTSDASQLLSRPPSGAGVFIAKSIVISIVIIACLLYTSPSPRDWMVSRMPSSA